MVKFAIRLLSRPPTPGRSSGISPSCLVGGVLVGVALAASSAGAQPADACVECHLRSGDERLARPARDVAHDVHRSRGFTCAVCHGGDSRDPSIDAMAPAKGFIGVPTHRQIPAVCGKCHSDPQFMRRYNPRLRIDQVAEYRTSVHGRRLATENDQKVAVCSSCHTAHTIAPASDAHSTVYPLHVAETCGHCHADAAYMVGYNIPTDQYKKYTASVHWARHCGPA